MRRRLIILAAGVILVGVLLGGCGGPQPKKLRLIDEIEVPISAYRYDYGWVQVPASKYTKAFNSDLGPDFFQLEDPEWWERLQDVFQQKFAWERETKEPEEWSILEVPSIDWLKENLTRGASSHYGVMLTLPCRGQRFQKAIDGETFKYNAGAWGYEREQLSPMWVLLDDGTHIFSGGILCNLWDDGVCYETLSEVQSAHNGILLLEFPAKGLSGFLGKNQYAVLVLPQELLQMEGSQLTADQPYETVVVAKVYGP